MAYVPGTRLMQTLPLLFLACAASIGCSQEIPQRPSVVEPIEILVDSPAWNGVGDDEIVARAGDVAISAWRVREAFSRADAGADPQEVLDSVLVEELLARKAVDGRGFVPERSVFERALASRYVEKKIVQEFQPQDVPEGMLKEMFALPQVWARFNHVDLYDVLDYQWICCSDPKSCDPAVFEECMNEGQAPMAAVRQMLEQDPPEVADMAIFAPEFKKRAYHLTYQEYSFAFDRKAGYQKGLTHIDSTLAEEVMKLSPGQFTSPVRSRFGWHIARLISHLPEASGDLQDPGVRLEIATFFMQRFRQDHFLNHLASLIGPNSLKLLQIYYENRPAPQGKPVYDVKLFYNALRDAAANEAEQKEQEPPLL